MPSIAYASASRRRKDALLTFRDQMIAGKRPDDIVASNPALLHPVYWKYRKALWQAYNILCHDELAETCKV